MPRKKINKKPIIGFMPGVFDLVHAGHILALKEAKNHCDYLVVGINIDPSIDNPSKNKPIMFPKERTIILEAIKYVDKTFLYSGEEYLHYVDEVGTLLGYKIDVRFMGADHRGEKHHFIRAKIVYIPRNHNYSSTELRKRINETKII